MDRELQVALDEMKVSLSEASTPAGNSLQKQVYYARIT